MEWGEDLRQQYLDQPDTDEGYDHRAKEVDEKIRRQYAIDEMNEYRAELERQLYRTKSTFANPQVQLRYRCRQICKKYRLEFSEEFLKQFLQ